MISIEEEIEELLDTIEGFDIISFDIFDTLLLRNVIHPTDIFKVVEREYYIRTRNRIDFYKVRVQAEEEARKHSVNEDITLDEIYVFVEKYLGSCSSNLRSLEIEMELKFVVANRQLKRVFDRAKVLNKTIYLISDMYLPQSVVEELLEQNDIVGYDEIFISSEIKYTKASGSLYSYILREKQVATNWIHIGDNEQSDVINAKKFGIYGYHFKKLSDRENTDSINTISDSIVRAIQINQKYLSDKQDYWYRFGVDIAAPIFIGLIFWLINKLKGKDNIYFLSRDGYLPFQLYEIVRGYYPELPKGRYLYASRRAYIYPYLLQVDQGEAIDTLTLYNEGFGQRLTLREILENIGLCCEKYQDQISRFSIESLNEVVDDKNLLNIKKFLTYIWDDIQVKLQDELELLKKYLNQNEIYNYKKINIFDIGWRGSTQLALQNIVQRPVHGYYFGTAENIYDEIKKNSCGYAFHLGKPLKNRNFILENVMMFEFIFSAPEGSLIHFSLDRNTNKVIPILKKVEQNDKLYTCVTNFQKAVKDVFQQVLEYKNFINDITLGFSLAEYKKFINSYQAIDMVQFSMLTNSVGFGESKDIKKYVTKVRLDNFLINPSYHYSKARHNLWRNAIVIQDKQGRYFNVLEIQKLYKIRRQFNKSHVKHLITLFRKALKNPVKAIKKVFFLLKILLDR